MASIPYKFGLVGSTDAHTGLAAVEEDNYFGKTSAMEPSADRSSKVFVKGKGGTIYEWETVSSGYAAVWATENTREALFDAMERRETYATTGSRMVVRLFGGFDFEAADANTRSPADRRLHQGRADGRRPRPGPGRQGADLPRRGPEGPDRGQSRPLPDRQGLGRRQGRGAGEGLRRGVVGRTQAGSRRQAAAGRQHRRRRQRNWTNTIGSPELIAVWRDPEFDPKQRAFYYGRVLEIPTPRWTAYDAKYYGAKLAPEVPTSIQERAYTSPIWYSPQG